LTAEARFNRLHEDALQQQRNFWSELKRISSQQVRHQLPYWNFDVLLEKLFACLCLSAHSRRQAMSKREFLPPLSSNASPLKQPRYR
jgi:hypothetical protein